MSVKLVLIPEIDAVGSFAPSACEEFVFNWPVGFPGEMAQFHVSPRRIALANGYGNLISTLTSMGMSDRDVDWAMRTISRDVAKIHGFKTNSGGWYMDLPDRSDAAEWESQLRLAAHFLSHAMFQATLFVAGKRPARSRQGASGVDHPIVRLFYREHGSPFGPDETNADETNDVRAEAMRRAAMTVLRPGESIVGMTLDYFDEPTLIVTHRRSIGGEIMELACQIGMKNTVRHGVMGPDLKDLERLKDATVWICVEIDESRLAKLLAGDIDLREAFLSPPDGTATFRLSDNYMSGFSMPGSTVPCVALHDDLLPSPGCFLAKRGEPPSPRT